MTGQLGLQYLLLNANHLTGLLPSFTLHHNLTQLNVHFNSLSGVIPPNISHKSRLQVFNVGPNSFTGSLPQFLGCPNLTILSVERNQFTGTLPDFSHLQKLYLLDVSGSRLVGNVTFQQPMSSLHDFSVASNQFNGTLDFMIDSLPVISKLDISQNNWNGALPSPLPITLPSTLQTFIAVGCTLTGPIPTSYANMTNLIVLILRDNRLTLPIPPFRTLLRLDCKCVVVLFALLVVRSLANRSLILLSIFRLFV